MKHNTLRSAIALALTILVTTSIHSQESGKLSGSIIGTPTSVDYTTGRPSTTVNTLREAFDGNPESCFASYDRSFTWVGLDLGEPHVITRVGYMARHDNLGPSRMELGVFQGANKADFSDALPIYLIPQAGHIGMMDYVDVDCSKGFRYVRYVGPHDARCNVAEIEFYGYAGEGDESHLYQVTNLPLVVVNTPGMEWFHSDKSYAMEGSQITIIADGRIDTNAPGQIRGRGNASWNFDKKPFRIKFDKKQNVLGSPATAKKWTMINNYGDKTLMRNKIAFEISRLMGNSFTPVCHFVDLIFNGEYQGCYQLCDQVEVNPGRVEITEMKAKDTSGEALTGGYLIEIDAYASEEPADEWFTSTGGHNIPVTIKSPDPGVSQQYNYIRSRFSEMERLVFASNFTDPQTGYRSMLDLDSFLRHFIIGELTGNTDTYWSTYMTLERGQSQFVVGPEWDFDIAFENDNRTYPINNLPDFVSLSKGSFANGMYAFVDRIIRRDASARERLKYLWSYAREYQNLNEQYFTELIRSYSAELEASQRLNFKRWPIMNTYVHMNPRVYGSYGAEVNNVLSFIKARFTKLDQLIGRVEVDNSVETIDGDITELMHTLVGGIEMLTDARFMVSNLEGKVIASGSEPQTVTLAPGIYVVKVADKVAKAVIR